MPFLRPGITRLFRIGNGREVDDEITLHLELRIESLMRAGMSRADAEREARRLFAESDASLRTLHTTARERDNRMRFREQWESLWQDVRYAIRRFAREPMATGFMVLTLALGIGANVTAFSLVDRILLRGPEHLVDPDALARLYLRTDRPPVGTQTLMRMPFQVYQALRPAMRGVTALSASKVNDGMIGVGAEAHLVRLGIADGDFFPMLGVRPLIGRFFAPGDDAATSGALAILSEGSWRREFSGDPAVLGRTVIVEGVPHRIIGVAPNGFTGPSLGRVDVWGLLDSRDARFRNWNVIVRRARGVPIATVTNEAEAAHRRTAEAGPQWTRDAQLLAAPIGYDEGARPPTEGILARWLAAISALVLLIACANVINLQLARLARRRQEIAIRIALGAGRGRVVRLMLIEGVLLTIASGVASLAVASITEPIVRGALFENAGWNTSITDGHLLFAVILVTLLTGVAIAVIPAIQAGNPRLAAALKSSARAGGRRSRVRQSLTVIQAALSVVLLVGAGLFLRSLARVRAVDFGMEPERVVVIEATSPLTPGAFEEQGMRDRIRYRRLLATVRTEPGVDRVALTIGLPFSGSVTVGLWVPGMDSIPSLPGGGPYITAVDADYFAVTGTRLLRGRTFTEQDREGSAPVVIVGTAMARLLWPSGDALDGCLIIAERSAPCARVVGVVSDIHLSGLHEEASLQYYVPIGQERGFGGMAMIIRPSNGVALSWPASKRGIVAADPSVSAVSIKLLSSALEGEMRPLRLGMVAFGLSALLALIVAALGLYSVMAYMVAWRTHEIGVRMALGATEGSVARLVVGGSVLLAGIGIVIGLAIAFAARTLIQPQLFEVSGADPVVFAGVAGALLLVAIVAGWLPARRAVRIRPTEALRAE